MKSAYIKLILSLVLGLIMFEISVYSNVDSDDNPAIIIFTKTSTIYNGFSQGVSLETQPAGLNVLVTYNGYFEQPTNVGEYQVTAKIIDDEYEGEASTTFNIYKAVATVTIIERSVEYDGSPKSPIVSTIPEGLNVDFIYAGDTSLPVNAGVYSVMAVISESNYNGGDAFNFIIHPAEAQIQVSVPEAVYNGSEHSVDVVTIPEELNYEVKYNNETPLPINAGAYLFEVEVTDPNYTAIESGNLVVEKASVEVSVNAADDVYDGIPKPAEVYISKEGINVNVLYNGSSDIPVDAGEYSVTAIIDELNYQGFALGNFNILKADIEINIKNLTWTYDGLPKSATADCEQHLFKTNLFYDGSQSQPVDAGKYMVLASVEDKNYRGLKVDTMTIEPQAQDILWNQNITELNIGDKIVLQAVSSENLDISYESNNTDVATIEGVVLAIQGMGKAKINAYQDGTGNIAAASNSIEIEVLEEGEISGSNTIKLWPNPVHQDLQIFSEFESLHEIRIVNGSGNLVAEQNHLGSNPMVSFANFPSGIYIVKIKTGKINQQFKVFRQ